MPADYIDVIIQDEEGKDETIQVTEREKLFVEIYFKTKKKRQSAIDAGYAAKGAHVQAHRVMNTPRVKKYFDYYRRVIFDNTKASIEEIIIQLSESIRVDPIDIFEDDGTLKPLNEIPKAARMIMTGLDTKTFEMPGDQEGVITERKVRFDAKKDLMEKLIKMLGGYESDNVQKGSNVIIVNG